jgi:hypothetical protein
MGGSRVDYALVRSQHAVLQGVTILLSHVSSRTVQAITLADQTTTSSFLCQG